jgi:RsiW-degrading membrane proteinase PrsW (M82 family)
MMRLERIFKTGLLNIFFLLGFLILMFVLGRNVLVPSGGGVKFLVLALIVLIPSFVCTLFFYLQDRMDPEPVSHVLFAFFAGMAAASLGIIPLLHIVMRVQEWIHASSSLFLLGSFLVTSLVVSAFLYVIIRYGFYPLKEFDEPVDGMVHGAVAGTGIASVLSLHHLIARPDCTLFVVTYTSISNILIYSAVGALVGYILGQAKFKRRSVELHSLTAVALSLMLLGVYRIVNEFIFISGFEGAFWLSFGLSFVYALMVLVYGTLKMRRLTQKPSHVEVYTCPKFDYLAGCLIILLMVLANVVAAQGLKGNKFEDPRYGISFYYPHTLSHFSFGALASMPGIRTSQMQVVFSGQGSGESPYLFSVRLHRDGNKRQDLSVMRYVEALKTESLLVDNVYIDGILGKRIAYSYITKGEDTFPRFVQLMQVYTDVVSYGDFNFVFSYKASSENFQTGLDEYEDIIQSVALERVE